MRCVRVVLVATLLVAGNVAHAERSDLNLLLITLDTTRADRIGCYGYGAALTPALDALATKGTLFEQAFTSCPMTLPAHATIMTGLHPPEHGVRRNGKEALGSGIPTLAELLAERGYQTGAFVAAFVLDARFGLNRGFQTYDDDVSAVAKQPGTERLAVARPGSVVTDAALAWLDSATGPGVDRPLFCWVHLYDPHYPYVGHPELAGTRLSGAATYDAEIAYTDRQVARLVDFLRERGLAERTLVVVVGDHGEGLGEHSEVEHGYLLNEEALHVPLIVSLPGVVREGARSDVLVSLADIAPTVLQVLSVPHTRSGRGRSLVPLLRGNPMQSFPLYAETDLPFTAYGWSPLRALTTPSWRYVRTPRPELYDRAADPHERHNLAPARPDQVRELDATLAELESTLTAAAPGARVPSADEQRRLEALGYVQGGDVAAPTAVMTSLPDIKTMLPAKHVDARLASATAAGTIDAVRTESIARRLVHRSPNTARFHHVLGTALLESGRTDEAIEQLSDAVRLRPDYPEAHINLGNALAHHGRTDEAITHYDDALRTDPNSADARVGRGNALAATGRVSEAIAEYEMAIRVAPLHAGAHFDLANALVRERRVAEAVDHYEEAIRLRPNFMMAHHNLGVLLARRGRPRQALTHLSEAVRLAPDFASAQYDLGRVLAEEGENAKAIAHYSAAVRLKPESPEFADNLAAAYAAAGRLDDAIGTARRAGTLAAEAGRPELAREIEQRVALYEHMKLGRHGIRRQGGGG